MKSISKSNYVKDKVLFNFYNDFIEEGGKIENLAKTNVVINTPFLQEKSVTQRWYVASNAADAVSSGWCCWFTILQ